MNKNDVEICSIESINPEKIQSARKALPPDEQLTLIAETFKTLSDPNRLRMMLALSKEELCVCDLATLLHMSVSAVSHQLRLLRSLRLVKFRKEGKQVYYSMEDSHIEQIVEMAQIHVKEFDHA